MDHPYRNALFVLGALFSSYQAMLLADTEIEKIGAPILILDDFVVIGSSLYIDEVNALKTPTTILQVPQSLTIMTADQISQQGLESINDIVEYTPGVNISQGEGHRDAVVFRGVRSTSDFFVDGVRDDVQYYRPLYNVERVEFLRGSNALFFGRGGTGGVLNRVMKKGVLRDNFNVYKLSINTFGGTLAQFDKNLALGDATAVRINVFKNDLEGHRDFFYADEFGINPTVKFKLSDHAVLDLSYEFLDTDRFIDRGIPTSPTTNTPVDAFKDIVFGDERDNYSTLTAHIYRASFQNGFSEALKSIINITYNDFDKRYQNVYPNRQAEATDPTIPLGGYVDTTKRDNLILSADLIGEYELLGMQHTLVAGVESISTNNANTRDKAVFTNEFTIVRPIRLSDGVGMDSVGAVTNDFDSFGDNTSNTVSVFGIYLNDEIDLTEKLGLVLGARLDDIDQNSIKYDVNGDVSEAVNRNDSVFTPRLGFVYKAKENLNLYASYSEAYQLKSGDEQYATASKTNLDPNTYENSEIGLKWDFNNSLSLTAALFEIDTIQQESYTGGLGEALVRDLEGKISGFEFQLQGKITDRWFLIVGYSQLDGEDSDGDHLRELPERTISLWNKYLLNDRLSLGFGLTHQADSLTTTGGTAYLPAYTRMDAAAYCKISDSISLQLNIENLTDELYYPSAHKESQVTVGAPLNATFSVVGKF
ncbi:MAG: putative TonB-dependent receptor BfrD [Opitutia bacterium UBA7350]|nr:MAG: putative TonB-dependent receptor BfrD [Opitutae bacterium UBA7350]